MIGVTEASIGFLLLIAFLFLGLHVAVAMFLIALLGAALYLGPPLVAAFGTQLWGAMEDYVLLSIPLYILLGEILVRSGSSDRLYRSLADWLNILPGGLLHRALLLMAILHRGPGVEEHAASGEAVVPCLPGTQ